MANGDDIGKAAGAELAAMGGAPAPQKAGGFNIGNFLGEVVKHAGLFAASAAIPGFGEGYVSGLAQREAQAAQERQNLEGRLLRDPDLILQFPELQKRAKNIFGNDITQQFVQAAEERRGLAQAAALIQQFAGTQGPSAFVPAIGGEQTQALFTPTGQVVVSGGVGTQPIPALGALARGEMQETLKFTPKGMTRELKPTPSTELERRGRIRETTEIAKTQRELMRTRGLNAVEARIEALQQAQRLGADLTQLSPEDRALLEMTPPGADAPLGAAARRIVEETTAKAGAERAAALAKPPGGTYVNPQTFETFPSGATLGEIEAVGGVKVDASQRGALRAAQNMDRIAADLKDAINVLFTTDDPKTAFKNALAFRVAGKTRGLLSITGDPRRDQEIVRAVTKLMSLRGDVGQLARSRSGEVGVLTQQDIERVFATIPGLREGSFEKMFETRTTAEELIRIFDERVIGAKRAILGLGEAEDGFTVEIEP